MPCIEVMYLLADIWLNTEQFPEAFDFFPEIPVLDVEFAKLVEACKIGK